MGQIKVTQTRSAIGSKPKQRGTLRALGLGRIGAGALDRVFDGMGAQLLGLGVVEGPAIGPAYRGAGGGDDDGFGHGESFPVSFAALEARPCFLMGGT